MAPSASRLLYNHTDCILRAVHKHRTTIDGGKVGGGVTIITRGLYSSASYTFTPTLTTTVNLKNKKIRSHIPFTANTTTAATTTNATAETPLPE